MEKLTSFVWSAPKFEDLVKEAEHWHVRGGLPPFLIGAPALVAAAWLVAKEEREKAGTSVIGDKLVMGALLFDAAWFLYKGFQESKVAHAVGVALNKSGVSKINAHTFKQGLDPHQIAQSLTFGLYKNPNHKDTLKPLSDEDKQRIREEYSKHPSDGKLKVQMMQYHLKPIKKKK
jgi:hypothetical protein